MMKHIVFWTLKSESGGLTAQQNALEIKARLEALNGRIPGLLNLEVGIDSSRTDASADLAMSCEFADRAALDAYRVHPEHLVVADFIGAARLTRTLVDYEV
jgi:hypothetical protein